MVEGQYEHATKLRIKTMAARLFAEKGFTETSTRELAQAVGLNAATLYYHFPSKDAILQSLLQDYLKRAWIVDPDIEGYMAKVLRDNPTADGILSCMILSFPADRVEYMLDVLQVLMQEQFRHPVVRDFQIRNLREDESFVVSLFGVLKKLGILPTDADPDFWMKLVSSILYAFSSRMALGNGDAWLEYQGLDMKGLLRELFDLLLRTYQSEPS